MLLRGCACGDGPGDDTAAEQSRTFRTTREGVNVVGKSRARACLTVSLYRAGNPNCHFAKNLLPQIHCMCQFRCNQSVCNHGTGIAWLHANYNLDDQGPLVIYSSPSCLGQSLQTLQCRVVCRGLCATHGGAWVTSDEVALRKALGQLVLAVVVLLVSLQQALQTTWICVGRNWHNFVKPTWSKTLRFTAF